MGGFMSTKKGKIGKPKYNYGDIVSFKITVSDVLSGKEADKEYELTGMIGIIDAYGTFEQNEEPSYDIWVDGGGYPISYPCLFKHFRESKLKLIRKGTKDNLPEDLKGYC